MEPDRALGSLRDLQAAVVKVGALAPPLPSSTEALGTEIAPLGVLGGEAGLTGPNRLCPEESSALSCVHYAAGAALLLGCPTPGAAANFSSLGSPRDVAGRALCPEAGHGRSGEPSVFWE